MSFRGSTAVVGTGSTGYYKRGTSPLTSAQLILTAILRACEDAGADPRSIDGFVSYGGDSSEGLAIGAALGVREVRWSTEVWAAGRRYRRRCQLRRRRRLQRSGRLRRGLPRPV